MNSEGGLFEVTYEDRNGVTRHMKIFVEDDEIPDGGSAEAVAVSKVHPSLPVGASAPEKDDVRRCAVGGAG